MKKLNEFLIEYGVIGLTKYLLLAGVVLLFIAFGTLMYKLETGQLEYHEEDNQVTHPGNAIETWTNNTSSNHLGKSNQTKVKSSN